MAPLLEIKNLSVEFRTTMGPLRAVDGVDLVVDTGDVVGIVGESGSGKSVAMLAVMGLLPWTAKITADRLAFQGQPLLGLSPRQRRALIGRDLAMIFQEPMSSLNPCFTVEFQITEALRVHEGMRRGPARERALELLDLVGIPSPKDRLGVFPHQLSGGMSQRVMIAMAIACNPKLLIADEPTTALDVTIQAQILDLMRTLQTERDTGVILVTHSMGVVAGMADRIQVMYAGHIVETSTTEEIFANPRHPYTVGLLKSIPRLDATRKEKLEPIRGLPPDLIDLPDMCPFVPRCNYAREKCEQKNPPLLEVAPGHFSACWFWEDVSKDDDQNAIAEKYGHPLPSDISDSPLPGGLDMTNPELPTAPPNINTNSIG